MPVVTLISDLGTNDYHLPAVKGYLLSKAPGTTLVDITHNIKPYHYIEAAFILRHCYKDFPAGTIHLVGVEGDFTRKNEFIVSKIDGHIFIAKNTGLLSLVCSHPPEWCYLLPVKSKKDLKFPMKLIMAKAAVRLAKGAEPASLGTVFNEVIERRHLEPVVTANSITGTIVMTNSYSNVVTNIHRKDFEGFKQFSKCRVQYNKLDHFDRIFNSFHDVPEGVAACFFGHHGLLELGINGGNGQGLLSLHEGKQIRIELQ